MNERIRELHGQAYLYALHNETKAREGGCHEPGTFNNDYREKFAELIVRECVQVAHPRLTDVGEWAAGMRLVQKRLKQHFGVDE